MMRETHEVVVIGGGPGGVTDAPRAWFRLDASPIGFAEPFYCSAIFEESLGYGLRNASRNGPVTVEG